MERGETGRGEELEGGMSREGGRDEQRGRGGRGGSEEGTRGTRRKWKEGREGEMLVLTL